MKKKMTLALAAAIFTLTLSAFPPHAAATTSTPPPPPPPASSGTHIKKVVIELASLLVMFHLL